MPIRTITTSPDLSLSQHPRFTSSKDEPGVYDFNRIEQEGVGEWVTYRPHTGKRKGVGNE